MTEPAPIRDTSKADQVYALACELLPALRAVARSNGYALAYHGSFARDIDVIAAPWSESSVDAHELAEVIRAEAERVSGHTALWFNDETSSPTNYLRRSPEPKPHGRLGWSIHLTGTGAYIDLSVLSAGKAHLDVKLSEIQRKLDAAYEEIITQSKRARAAEAEMASVRGPVAVHLVRQQDQCGCMVACLAMVTGRPYAELRAYFIEIGKSFEGEHGGIHEYDAESYLADHGFAVARKYRWLGANVQRAAWPVSPFAPVHILGVRGAGAHGVVLLPEGSILDPLFDEPRQLSDYPDVAYMLGVFRVQGLEA